MRMPREQLKPWLGLGASVALHATIVLCVFIAPSLFVARSATWGSKTGGNGGVNIKIVNNVAGLALPAPLVTSDDAVASENKSVHKAEPEPKPKAPQKSDPAAIKLPSKTAPKDSKEMKQPAATAPVKTASADLPTPTPANAVPYGAGGGNPSIRYGQTAPGTGPTGADFAGDGTFGQKYGDYVDRMTTAITEAWRGINISQQRYPRVYVLFTIEKNGKVTGAVLENATSNPSTMERAALRAVNTAAVPPLPSDYRGPPVAVRFYFDYAK